MDAPNRHPEAQDLCDFVNASPSAFHAVGEAMSRLEAAGFSALDEGEEWSLTPGEGYYLVRGGGSLLAFRVGEGAPSKAGFSIIGSHTDSPNLRLKPQAAYSKENFGLLGVEIYGGVLLHTWLDRDLGVAGRVALRDDSASSGYRLINLRVDEPLCRVTSLAIHLHRNVNDKGLVLNKQTHMPPIFATLSGDDNAKSALNSLLLSALGEPKGEILGHDLSLFDVNPAQLGGLDKNLVFSPRLDNLASVHSSLAALIDAPKGADATRLIALFDHEEIGSRTHRGAASSLLGDTLRRICLALGDDRPSAYERAIAKSFSISADMSHAVHPNYSDKHESHHMPYIGKGPVIKSNANQRYASDGETTARFRAICRRADVPVQEFVNRTDLGCGSTIGPITATELGISTVDVGNPMTSMHSIRELGGSEDVPMMIRAMSHFFGAE